MSAPTISELPELPVFPARRGQPDQPGVFFPKLLAFLDALRVWRTEANAVATFVEANAASGGSNTASAFWIPAVTGAEPPSLVTDGAGKLVMAPWNP